MTATEKRNYAAELMVSRKGRNEYTQGSKRKYFFGYPDNAPGNTSQEGFSDCSSAVRAAIREAAGIDIGSNTTAQINNRSKGLIVDETDGYYPDESKLKPGDCLYFKGNTSHPMDVGHVEMYIGDGKICGHGSGTGPKVRGMKDYCKSRASSKKRYFMAIRWIWDEGDYPSGSSGASSPDKGSLENGAQPTPDKGSLCKGMYDSSEVKKLQRELNQLGYDLEADGDFGELTEQVVMSFQRMHDLPATGIADQATLKMVALALDELDDGDDDDEPAESGAGVTIKRGTWNVRSGPGKEYRSVGRVKGGATLEKVETDWVPVIFEGAIGWISPKAVEE